ncbi:MAG: hypothetical protein A2X05_09190 [Bacteroidetes bacterium GWE2_41_25]|nr:MAG: hypothetical protein A2X03_04895 [Bacteroidetes bacterium GWA2_40_15]OFX87891.1 MAG: hypothetical protein A2X06_13090 [Bacteroidetes bacterium GWC2_40_22]OFY05449.1 MAG: hypothetical protein A2X05_09190 [Bacteroidetes bacterium GWE2_41_25]OFY57910.1 MAG: hypothetical protein A2X04_10950 [Bacteroidetes bacterium GWF2_41_9]HAM10796.1 hypothetical protein [Bacteroidales bacterium]
MKKLISLWLILIVFASCKKHSDYQLRILIRNGTDSLLTVTLYPKPDNMRIGKYIYSDIFQVYKDTTFAPDARLGSELFVTKDISIEPHLLAARIFDSIHVKLSSGKTLFRFSPSGAINYPKNLFTDRSAWVYEKNRFELVKMWRDYYIESDDYIFVFTGGN